MTTKNDALINWKLKCFAQHLAQLASACERHLDVQFQVPNEVLEASLLAFVTAYVKDFARCVDPDPSEIPGVAEFIARAEPLLEGLASELALTLIYDRHVFRRSLHSLVAVADKLHR